MVDEDHHRGPTPLSCLPVGLVSSFVLDYMHLVCLGVMRRMVHYWLKGQGLNCQKISGGVDICLFIVITHRQFSIINNGGGLKLTPRGIPGHLVWGVKQTTGGFNPPNPSAIQTLVAYEQINMIT
jgi:hypothetical protein